MFVITFPIFLKNERTISTLIAFGFLHFFDEPFPYKVLTDRTAHSMIGSKAVRSWHHNVVCPSVCLSVRL